jgi:hypothetical protein
MIWAIFKKDWTLLWPLAVLVALIQIAFEWATYKFGFFGVSPLARELLRLLGPAWFIGVIALAVAAVHEDTIPGVDQDWLVRPVRRRDLLLAKMLFVLVTVCLPMLALNVSHARVLGFPAESVWLDALYKEAYLFVCLLIPAMAVAAATRNMRDLIVLVAGLVVLYVVSLWVAAVLLGSDRCPTCDTSVSWLQHLLQHAGVLVGSAIVLGLQYYQRRTRLSRILLAVGVVLLVYIQLPWGAAFTIQTWMGAPLGTPPAAIRITVDPAEMSEAGGSGHHRPGAARRATQALLQGDVDTAVDSLKDLHESRAVPATLAIPLRVTGLTNNDLLVVDRAEVSLLDATGTVLYRTTGAERKSVPLQAEAADPQLMRQRFEIPGAVYRRIGPKAVRLVVDYSLTIRAVVAEHRMPAVGGVIRSGRIGVCQSSADQNEASVRCKQIGLAPNCYAATLYGPDGRHNPQVQYCGSDYRPFIPIINNIVNFNGIDMPIRDNYGVAHYEVDGSDLPDSYIILKVYETGRHFHRTVTAPLRAVLAD